jgi:hypothetical protein
MMTITITTMGTMPKIEHNTARAVAGKGRTVSPDPSG